MAVSLLHRLTQLPTDWIDTLAVSRLASGDLSKATTTTDVVAAGADPADLAHAIAAVAGTRNRRVMVGTLSEAQRDLLDFRSTTPQAQRVTRWLEQAARETPIRQRVTALHDREIVRGASGDAAAVVVLWDGAIRSTPLAQRTRESRRYTLSDDVIAWIGEESARSGESASAVVEGALRAMMRGES